MLGRQPTSMSVQLPSAACDQGGSLVHLPKPQAMLGSLNISPMTVLATLMRDSTVTPVQAGTFQVTLAAVFCRTDISMML